MDEIAGAFVIASPKNATALVRMASFEVSPRHLADSLHIPADHEIVGAYWEFETSKVRLIVAGPDLPERKEGDRVARIWPIITVNVAADGTRSYSWDWNLHDKE